jgi:hypothetical protein
MKQSDIVIGGEYETRIGESLVRVRVVGTTETYWGKRSAFRVRRVDTGRDLPKPRTAAALRPVGGAS